MLHTDADFVERVEQAVRAVESTTDAEVVVVAAPRSGSYRDVALGCGIAAGMAVLLIALFAPVEVRPIMVPIEVAAFGALAWLLASRSPRLLRQLTSAARREQQVATAARAAFVEEAVYGTRNRTGLLVYVSALEDRVLLLPDAGLAARIPGGEWNAVRWGEGADPSAPGDLEHFLQGLGAVGAVLAAHVPALGDNPNELSDAPRIRS